MSKWIPVSLCKQGILGGAMWFEEDGLVFRTNKLSVPAAWRCIRMPCSEIVEAIQGSGIARSTVQLCMADGTRYRFLVFGVKGFYRRLRALGVPC